MFFLCVNSHIAHLKDRISDSIFGRQWCENLHVSDFAIRTQSPCDLIAKTKNKNTR